MIVKIRIFEDRLTQQIKDEFEVGHNKMISAKKNEYRLRDKFEVTSHHIELSSRDTQILQNVRN